MNGIIRNNRIVGLGESGSPRRCSAQQDQGRGPSVNSSRLITTEFHVSTVVVRRDPPTSNQAFEPRKASSWLGYWSSSADESGKLAGDDPGQHEPAPDHGSFVVGLAQQPPSTKCGEHRFEAQQDRHVSRGRLSLGDDLKEEGDADREGVRVVIRGFGTAAGDETIGAAEGDDGHLREEDRRDP